MRKFTIITGETFEVIAETEEEALEKFHHTQGNAQSDKATDNWLLEVAYVEADTIITHSEYEEGERHYFAVDGNYGDAKHIIIADTRKFDRTDWAYIEDASDSNRWATAYDIVNYGEFLKKEGE